MKDLASDACLVFFMSSFDTTANSLQDVIYVSSNARALKPDHYPDEFFAGITIELLDTSSKWVQSIDLKIDNEPVAARLEPGGSAETSRKATLTLGPKRSVSLSSVHSSN